MRKVIAALAGSGAIALVGSLGAAAPASGSNFGVELNGTYRVISNGDWAKTNEVFIDEKTVVQTWAISSSCTSPISCTGTVASDEGWTASAVNTGDYWVVDRVIPGWEPCPDGTAATGAKKYMFWGIDPVAGATVRSSANLMAGLDRTMGPSGACGINKPLVIELPMRLEKLS